MPLSWAVTSSHTFLSAFPPPRSFFSLFCTFLCSVECCGKWGGAAAKNVFCTDNHCRFKWTQRPRNNDLQITARHVMLLLLPPPSPQCIEQSKLRTSELPIRTLTGTILHPPSSSRPGTRWRVCVRPVCRCAPRCQRTCERRRLRPLLFAPQSTRPRPSERTAHSWRWGRGTQIQYRRGWCRAFLGCGGTGENCLPCTLPMFSHPSVVCDFARHRRARVQTRCSRSEAKRASASLAVWNRRWRVLRLHSPRHVQMGMTRVRGRTMLRLLAMLMLLVASLTRQ